MNKCTNCGSHAINPHMHGRGGDNLDLCDVCYWRARFAALREAVAWERECEQLDFWGVAYALCRRHPGNYIDAVRADFYAIRDSARDAVDRLIADENAADCKGEG